MKRKSCDSQIKSLVDGYANRSDATGMNLNELMDSRKNRFIFSPSHTQVIGRDHKNVRKLERH